MATKAQVAGYGFSFELQGLKELDDMLRQLPKTMSKAVLRKGLQKAAVPTREAAIGNVPQGETGKLKESIKIATRLKRSQRRGRLPRKDAVEVFVGSDAPHAHLVEFGTKERYRDSGGRTGRMPEAPFLSQAWERTRHQALDIFANQTAEELEKAAKRLRKRAEKGTLGKKAIRELL